MDSSGNGSRDRVLYSCQNTWGHFRNHHRQIHERKLGVRHTDSAGTNKEGIREKPMSRAGDTCTIRAAVSHGKDMVRVAHLPIAQNPYAAA